MFRHVYARAVQHDAGKAVGLLLRIQPDVVDLECAPAGDMDDFVALGVFADDDFGQVSRDAVEFEFKLGIGGAPEIEEKMAVNLSGQF